MEGYDFKARLEEALQEPSPPEALIEETVRRVRMVTAGQRTEEQLCADVATGESLPEDDKVRLTATILVGQVARQIRMPQQITAEEMIAQLSSNMQFRRSVDCPLETILERVRSGTLLKDLRGRLAIQHAVVTKANEASKNKDSPARQ